MTDLVISAGVLLLLIIANGIFATAEMAFVSVRRAKLKTLAEGGSLRARVALELVLAPNRFLSTVQVGITVIGVVAGAFGGARVAEQLAVYLRQVAWIEPYSRTASFVLVVSLITFLSLVLGELAPKRVALSHPLKLSLLLAHPMHLLSSITAPVVALLSNSTDFVLKIFSVGSHAEPAVTNEEVKQMVEQGHHAGVFHKAEIEMVAGVMELDQVRVGEMMTPRLRIVWLNVLDSDQVNWRKIVASTHTYFPVYQGQRDNLIGLVSVKSLWANLAAGAPAKLKDLAVKPLFVPESMNGMRLLETFKESRKHLALVSDEFGNVSGMVTVTDLLEAIVGDLPVESKLQARQFRRREDGSILVDAVMDIEDFKERLGLQRLAEEESADYRSVGGFIMSRLERIPMEGDSFECAGYRFEVIDMDRHRVDKVLVQPLAGAAGGGTDGAPST